MKKLIMALVISGFVAGSIFADCGCPAKCDCPKVECTTTREVKVRPKRECHTSCVDVCPNGYETRNL